MLNNLKQLIKKAGKEALNYYDRTYDEAEKEAFPVTEADLASEKILLEGLRDFSNYGILSEEHKESTEHLKYDKVFIIDPLDGTKDFVHKTGDFSVMLARLEHGEPTLGMVYSPTDDRLYYAEKGKGAYREQNGERVQLKVSPEEDPTKMKIIVSRFHPSAAETHLEEAMQLEGALPMGSAGLKICTIAEGNAHIYVSTTNRTGEWDTAPGVIILHEAEGTITDIHGKPLEFNKKKPYNINGFIASNDPLHTNLVEHLSKLQ